MRAKAQTLIVRLWPRPDGPMAEVRPLQGGEPRTFQNLSALCRYLEAISSNTSPDPPTPKGGQE
jgi:hypothetical protein